jgi:lysophospholipase L1-like esterase
LRIVVFSDSLGLPRPHLPIYERTAYEDVYSHRLRQKLAGLCEVEICYFISLDSEEAVSLAKYQIAFRRPDLVIFHLGVNDCAPRVFKKGNRNIVFRPWFPKQMRRLVLGFVRRYRRFLTRYVFRNRVYVPLDRFRQNLLKLQEIIHAHSPHCLFLALSIVPTLPSLSHRSYGFNANVARYNVVLREIFGENYVDLDGLLGGTPEAYLLSDGIHLQKQSHIQVAEHLYTCITRLFEING